MIDEQSRRLLDKSTEAASKTRGYLISASTALVGLICGYLISVFVDPKLLIAYNYSIVVGIASAIGAIVILWSTDIHLQARETRKAIDSNLKEIRGRLNTLDTVPSLVSFLQRSDTIWVTDTYDGIFEWVFLVEYNSDADKGIHYLNFPVIADVAGKEGQAGDNVEVQSINVRGEPKSCYGVYTVKEIRTPHPFGGADVSQQYGIVKVPVELNSQLKQAAITLKIKYKSIFKKIATGDYVIVDIPYVTNDLKVIIQAENSKRVVAESTGQEVIEAYCEMMAMRDYIEESHQLPRVSTRPKSIEWNTKNAKIGYRYRLHFRVVDDATKTQS
jgi:hypothetical protein